MVDEEIAHELHGQSTPGEVAAPDAHGVISPEEATQVALELSE